MACLPEELLERILAHAIPPPRPLWLRSPSSSSARLAPLTVSRQFHRIATPLLYHTVYLASPSAAALLLQTLCARPEYAQHVRELTVLGVWSPAIDVLRLCSHLSSLDLTITFDDDPDVDLAVFETLTAMRHLTLRKPAAVYLSLARPRALINAVARAISAWPHLCTANIAFKLSDDTPTSPTSSFSPFSAFTVSAPAVPSGPITALASALAAAPALVAFSTHLPSVWNASIALIAANPALDRICLYPASASAPGSRHAPPASVPAIPGTGLFLMEARRHPRLAELIAAGTPIIRSRAHTLGTHLPVASASASASATATATPQPKSNIGLGLGLRIDTSPEAIGAPMPPLSPPLAEAEVPTRYRSPGIVSSPRAIVTANANINPAWMRPVRKPLSAAAGAGAKGRPRRV